MRTKHYFPFIDTVKGVGVFCVLITHMSWVVGYNQSLLTNFVSTFCLGVLFIASGFVSGKIWQQNVTWRTLLDGKYYRILVPFFIVGIFSVILKDLNLTGEISKNPFRKLLMELFNGGYWYLLSLFIYRIATILTQIITGNYVKLRLSRWGGVIC